MRLWVVLVLICALAVPAAAQAPPPQEPPQTPPTEAPPAEPPPVFELPEVTVPGRRPQPRRSTPASVTVITRDELERIGARTVAEVLRLVPEASVRTYGGMGSLAEASIRGFGPGQVLVLIDGVPVNNVALGQADLSTISTLQVERVEVLRGAFGGISGSGAVGGVINIVTGGGPSVQARTGGFGERSLRVAAGGASAGLALESAASAGFRPNSDAAMLTAVGRLTLGGTHLAVHHTAMELGTPGDVAFPTPQDRQALDRTLVQASWGSPAGPVWGRVHSTWETLTFSSPFGQSVYRSQVAGAALQRQWPVGPERVLVLGLDARRERLDASVFGSPIEQEAAVGAVTLQHDAALSARTLLSTAVRLDAHSAYGATVNPRAGLVVALDPATLLRVGAGRTFRGPTFLHLYFPGCSDPALRPETAWTAEASLERSRAARVTTLTLFQTDARDLISGGCPPQNIGAAFIRGASVEVRAAVGGGWSVRAHATVQEALDRATGAPLPRVPGVSVQTAVMKEAPGASLTLLAGYVGPRTDADFSVFPPATVLLPGYVDVALRYERRLPSGWSVTAGVDNALDAAYEVVKGYPAPGRTVFIMASRRY